ncbi:hypothetical protein FUAX_21300 [Fulvitalea axinellae]|uniref:Uncharacterized protein n=1 Tax=Fulvitalea axinellae TaxID=1182444 RepID=A0AAU9D1A7_9BACT|nr:hypothetical protein FUAX_21300 [Fulvitalea axinellae]
MIQIGIIPIRFISVAKKGRVACFGFKFSAFFRLWRPFLQSFIENSLPKARVFFRLIMTFL